MLKKIVNIVVLVPVAIILIVLSVANRQTVTLALNPFNPADSVLSASAPFFVFIFLAVIFGLVVGSLATWFGQGKYRKRARNEAHEAVKWHAEAEKHRTRAETMAAQTLLPSK
ncbi:MULTISPECIES: hypothetical protein [unclassified Rhizobium]|uniref:hypothetical protein n=1 Tax=unclassified Rhizobium TaxID=2613769 RepID=UPI000712AD5E|nr:MULTISPECIES: hypothetical protein [unclassified Rhizobium]KQS90554.1 hypothetical protein ASG50_08475 [Rhizobium sp. Leaf386]KQS91203.1 hypothetical protein ASG42_08815 [Rhizobium sp. Leaf391]KQU10364.1 hypothetical protein ASG68_04345 [Rhizobium sp. Leaf453]